VGIYTLRTFFAGRYYSAEVHWATKFPTAGNLKVVMLRRFLKRKGGDCQQRIHPLLLSEYKIKPIFSTAPESENNHLDQRNHAPVRERNQPLLPYRIAECSL
jgi:hypothetical protein